MKKLASTLLLLTLFAFCASAQKYFKLANTLVDRTIFNDAVTLSDGNFLLVMNHVKRDTVESPLFRAAFNKLKVKGDLKDFTSATVCGIDGQEMPTTVIYRNDESLTLDLRLLAKGIYFLQIQIGEYLVTEKVIKE